MVSRICIEPGSGPFVDGIDVSQHQGTIDWPKVPYHIKYAFIRTGFGLGEDTQFRRNWVSAREADIICGAYHFFVAARGGIEQADHMLAIIERAGGLRQTDLPPVVDLEESYQTLSGKKYRDGETYIDPAVVGAECLAMLQRIEEVTGLTPIIYTGQYFHWKFSQNAPRLASQFAKYPLWVPSYDECVRMPTGGTGLPFPWTRWDFWQYTSHGTVEGINGRVDLDKFNGNLDDLVKLTIPVKPQAPETPGRVRGRQRDCSSD